MPSPTFFISLMELHDFACFAVQDRAQLAIPCVHRVLFLKVIAVPVVGRRHPRSTWFRILLTTSRAIPALVM